MDVRVRPGDSFWHYSQLFLIPLNLLIDSNRNVNPNALQIGQTIKIPGFETDEYTIQQGDTLWQIARRRNLILDALLLLNQDKNPQTLQIGEKIVLPRRVIEPLMNRKRAYSFNLLQEEMNRIQQVYPFVQINIIGESVQGKPIWELRIGNGSKKVHINASFHANEWITTPILMEILNTYLLSLTNGSSIHGWSPIHFYHQVDLSIVPMVNPDGVNLVIHGPRVGNKEELIQINKGSTDFSGWKANIRGVDLNNQYPANWEIEKERKEEKAPAPRDYPGDKPLSEPEAIAMAELARKENFDRVLALHTQGKEFYWGYEGLEPPESRTFAQEFERISGYRAVQYIDSHAGYKDWFIQEFRKPGFTIELGMGVNPLPISQFDEIYEDFIGIFLAALYL